MEPLTGRRVLIAIAGPDAAAARVLALREGARVEDGAAAGPRDVLVVDEWTAETAPPVRAARAAGARVTCLAEMLLERSPLPVLGVTGTAGKTTCARLAAAILAEAGIAPLITPAGRARNAWPDAALGALPPDAGDVLVAELTSTHLCHMDAWDGPAVAVVTCLWPDHVELHGSVDAYVAAKRRILRGGGWAVLNADDPEGRALLGAAGGRRPAEFSVAGPVARGAWIEGGRLRAAWDGGAVDAGPADAIPAWAHASAALAACAAALACGAPAEALAPGLRSAPPLPHRLARVGRVDGHPVVDDSMAATPRKARDDLRRFAGGAVVLVAGGDDAPGGEPVHAHPAERALLAEAAREMGRVARRVVLFGPAAARLAALLPQGTDAVAVASLADAVMRAREALGPGDTLLLCPAFPMDQAAREWFAALAAAGGEGDP